MLNGKGFITYLATGLGIPLHAEQAQIFYAYVLTYVCCQEKYYNKIPNSEMLWYI